MQRLYPRFIIIHHTAGFDVSALTINKYHARRGFKVKISSPKNVVKKYIKRGFPCYYGGVIISIGYHYLIRANGLIEKGRPDFVTGAHCRANRMNFRSIGIALTGNFDSKDNPNGKKGHKNPTLAQLKALKRLLGSLIKKYCISKDRVLLHREVIGAATSCPGDRFNLTF